VISKIILKTFELIEKQAKEFESLWVSGQYRRDPFRVLISCIISLRTKEAVTAAASARLFTVAADSNVLAKLSVARISRLIYPAGFYRVKARIISLISRRIAHEFGGKVPSTLPELLSFKGVGRKTANLVLGVGFGIPAICVDTHVHRISNRLGWLVSVKPEETEVTLMRIFPRHYWIKLNDVLVAFGQNVCAPVSPFCSRCAVNRYCGKVGVIKSR
jgi:endonuclease-3